MRIISGKFKNKKLHFPKNLKTRPLKDSVRENIFNILKHSNKIEIQIKNSSIVDLYAGTGSFGLECLSRDVKEVTFVENYSHAIKILKKNIQSLGLNNGYKILEENIFNLNKYSELKKNYDLIFADPPYKEEKIDELLSIIIEMNYLKKSGLLILHRNKLDQEVTSTKFDIIEERFYGISKIIFLRLK